MRTGSAHFLKEAGLTGIPDWFTHISICRHLGVPPDWFDDKPLIWKQWAEVHLAVVNDLSTPTQ